MDYKKFYNQLMNKDFKPKPNPPFLSVHATHPMDSLHALILVILTRKPE